MNTTNSPFCGRRLAVVAALALALCSSAANAQTQTYESVAGAWWFSVAGKDEGALLIEFSEPISGSFEVLDVAVTQHESFGFSRTLGTFFAVESGQDLTIDSKGQITGALDLTEGDSPAGEIFIEAGKPNPDFTHLNLRGTIAADGEPSLRLNLKGVRVPASFPVLTGRNPAARLAGKGVKSKAYELMVRTDLDLGLPAYVFTGAGPAQIDKVEVADVPMSGRVMLAPNNRTFGLLDESPDFGSGVVKGKLVLPTSSTIPKADFLITADRRLRTFARLTMPIEPVLSVTPSSHDFGAVRLDAAETQVFQVQNVGVGELSGEASFMNGSSPGFSIVGDASYSNLEPGDPAVEITVEFEPLVAGSAEAQLRFSVEGGAGARTVALDGSGGVPELDVAPDSGVFGQVAVGDYETISFILSNDGDGVLTGTATLSGSPDYALVADPVGPRLNSVDYSIGPQGEETILVRFTPSATGQRLGTLQLDGNVDATIDLTGTGTNVGL